MKLILTLTLVASLAAPPVFAAGSGAIAPAPEQGRDVRLYNQGVELMLAKNFAAAEKKFRAALAKRDRFAEAHNNLAYVLRKQGPRMFNEALGHYNRAIDLDASRAQPYMYRGVLFVQMGRHDAARADLDNLKGLDASLAGELEYVIAGGREKEPEQFFGVSAAID